MRNRTAAAPCGQSFAAVPQSVRVFRFHCEWSKESSCPGGWPEFLQTYAATLDAATARLVANGAKLIMIGNTPLREARHGPDGAAAVERSEAARQGLLRELDADYHRYEAMMQGEGGYGSDSSSC